MNEETPVNAAFVSTFTHSLDPKKRLTIPAVWREQVGGSSEGRLFVIPGMGEKPCLLVYPGRDMARRLARLHNVSMVDDEARRFARSLGSRTELVEWDSQGRIRVNDNLLSYANLQNQVVMVGAFEWFELWNPDVWREVDAAVNPLELKTSAQRIGF